MYSERGDTHNTSTKNGRGHLELEEPPFLAILLWYCGRFWSAQIVPGLMHTYQFITQGTAIELRLQTVTK